MNQELHDMFVADQTERNNCPDNDTSEYIQLRERDAQRQRRVQEMIHEGLLTAPDDYFHNKKTLDSCVKMKVKKLLPRS